MGAQGEEGKAAHGDQVFATVAAEAAGIQQPLASVFSCVTVADGGMQMIEYRHFKREVDVRPLDSGTAQ
jgi:hypothetical protein